MLILPSVASIHWAACFPATQGLGMMSENVNYGERSGITQRSACSSSRQQLKQGICFPSSVLAHQCNFWQMLLSWDMAELHSFSAWLHPQRLHLQAGWFFPSVLWILIHTYGYFFKFVDSGNSFLELVSEVPEVSLEEIFSLGGYKINVTWWAVRIKTAKKTKQHKARNSDGCLQEVQGDIWEDLFPT